MPYLSKMSQRPLLAILRTVHARRTGTLMLALSFLLLASGELLGLHHCAHHHQGAEGSGHHEEVPHTTLGGEPESHRAMAAGEDSEAGHGEDSLPCTCMGSCHGSAAVPAPPAAPTTPFALTASAVDQQPSESRAVRLLPHVLPFPNGPPARG